jgi:hypothetical protein
MSTNRSSVLLCLVALLVVGANAAPVTYALEGVTMSDGGTASGSFTYDPVTNVYSNVSVTTTAGSALPGATYHFVCEPTACTIFPAPSSNSVAFLTSTAANRTGQSVFHLDFSPVLGGGVSAVIGDEEGSCGDSACSFFPNSRDPNSGGNAVPIQLFVQISYAANLGAGQSVVNVTNAGTNGGNDATDFICANVYVFAQDQQLISCCACQLSPNDLQTLSVQKDLINNTLTPGVPTGVTIAILASDDTGKGACNASTVEATTLVSGLNAWGTKLHAAPGGGFAVTETPFSQAELSPSELFKMTSLCGFIESNGSGFGICNSCTSGAAGAAKKQ